MELGRYTTEQLDYPGDGLHYLGEEPFTGILEFRSPDGTLEAEAEYKDGLLSGLKRAWHRPGVLELEAECALGAYHGRVREWHESGTPATDSVYEYGICLRRRSWDESGSPVEDYALSESDDDYSLLQAFRRAEAGHRGGGGDEDAEPGAAADRGLGSDS
jgi:antitoxin component YwqK of YwqJK toxin-antitoxin module